MKGPAGLLRNNLMMKNAVPSNMGILGMTISPVDKKQFNKKSNVSGKQIEYVMEPKLNRPVFPGLSSAQRVYLNHKIKEKKKF